MAATGKELLWCPNFTTLANLSTLVARANALTFDVAKEKLSSEESLELLSATSAIYSYALSKAAHYESDTRVSYMVNTVAGADTSRPVACVTISERSVCRPADRPATSDVVWRRAVCSA